MEQKNRCLIIGGGGFIGLHLADGLVKAGYPVTIALRSLASISGPLPDSIRTVSLDITDEYSYKYNIQEGDIIFDLAAPSVPSTSMLHPGEEIENHIIPHMEFMEFAMQKKIKKYIFFSSGGGVYGENPAIPVPEDAPLQPISPYAISKVTIEYFLAEYSKLFSTPHLIYRLSNPYGPGQRKKPGFGIIPTLFDHIMQNTIPVLYNHGNLVRDFIYIDDVIEAINISFDADTSHTIYNLGSGVGTSVKDIWTIIKKIMKSNIEPDYQDKRPIDVEAVVLDISRFKNEFNWSPKISLEEGIERFCNHP